MSLGEVPMSITAGQWVKFPWQSIRASPCRPQVVCLSQSGMLVGGMPVECVGWNASGTGMPVEWNVLGGVPMERAGWNAHGMCWVECPWNVLGGIPMERVRYNAHETCWVECPWNRMPVEHAGWNGMPVQRCPWNVLGGMPMERAGGMPMERAGWNAHGTCWVECPLNVLGGMLIECAGWNLVGDNPSDKE